MSALLEARTVEASLAYDSLREAPEGARGFGSQPRMLLYKWNGLTVDLLLWDRLAQLCAVHGRVTEDPTGSPVVGADACAGETHVATDEFGQFAVVLGDEWDPRRLSIRTTALEVICAIPEAEANRLATR